MSVRGRRSNCSRFIDRCSFEPRTVTSRYRLIERKWRQHSADLGSVPRRHFRSNHVVRTASHCRLCGTGGAGMAAERVTSVVLAQMVELRGGRSSVHEVKSVAEHHTLLNGERPRQGRPNRQPFRSIRRAPGMEAVRTL